MTLGGDVARLGRARPFNLLPREAVQLIAFSGEKLRLKAGEALFHAGEIGEAAFFVHSGVVLLTSAKERSRRVSAGGLIGESALYGPIARRVDARVIEDAVVTRVTRETFRRVLSEFPAAAQKVRAELAARTRRLVDGLEATRVKSLDRAIDAAPGGVR